jgi:hypothetical protein
MLIGPARLRPNGARDTFPWGQSRNVPRPTRPLAQYVEVPGSDASHRQDCPGVMQRAHVGGKRSRAPEGQPESYLAQCACVAAAHHRREQRRQGRGDRATSGRGSLRRAEHPDGGRLAARRAQRHEQPIRLGPEERCPRARGRRYLGDTLVARATPLEHATRYTSTRPSPQLT